MCAQGWDGTEACHKVKKQSFWWVDNSYCLQKKVKKCCEITILDVYLYKLGKGKMNFMRDTLRKWCVVFCGC